jgi:hypothetical protein
MDDAKFNRLARAFDMSGSRRWLIAVLGAVLGTVSGFLRQLAAGASQLGPRTCRAKGNACTLSAGCCDGLTCATSSINTSYGICVPGEGGMVATGPTLISPFSETAVEEVAPRVQTASTAPATDPKADRKAHIQELRARKDEKRSKQRTRLDTKRSTQQTRKDEQQNRESEAGKSEAGKTVGASLGPQLQLELILSTEDDSKTAAVENVNVETVKVTNLDDVNIVITRIESILAPKDGTSLTTSPAKFTLVPRKSYFFVAGLTPADATIDRFDWTNGIACDGTLGAGYLVKAAFSVNPENHDFAVLCAGPHTVGFVETPAAAPVHKPKKNDGQKRKRNNQRQNKKKR